MTEEKRFLQAVREIYDLRECDGVGIDNTFVDSFLMFAANSLNDSSFYPFWARISYGDLDDFLYYLFFWNGKLPHRTVENTLFIKEYILNNPQNVWIYFMTLPSFEVLNHDECGKFMLPLPFVSKILGFLVSKKSSQHSKSNGESFLIKMIQCNQFVDYLNRLWDDVSNAIRYGASGLLSDGIGGSPFDSNFFNSQNRLKVLGTIKTLSLA